MALCLGPCSSMSATDEQTLRFQVILAGLDDYDKKATTRAVQHHRTSHRKDVTANLKSSIQEHSRRS